MVQQIENWSVVRGRVRAVGDDPDRADFRRVTLDVGSVQPVTGVANALEPDAAGRTIDVAVPRDADVPADAEVELHVRSSPVGYFAHPDKVRVIG